MIPVNLREQIPNEVFDYQTLLGVLAEYASPRDKISDLLRRGMIIKVKKGLYIFGKDARKKTYSHETLANLIYGPSYISLDYALQSYGLIPERVETVTSVTTGQSKTFSTPVGNFSYRKIGEAAFASGMDIIVNPVGHSYLIAVPEKALVDKILSDRGMSLRTQTEMECYLVENLRVEITDIQKMNVNLIEEYAKNYHSRKAGLLARLMHRLNNKARRGRHE